MSTTPFIIATSMYCDSPEESSAFPSAGKKSHDADFQAIYWRCVCVFFKTARHFNPKAQLVLFTNIEKLPTVEGFQLEALLRELNVKTVRLNRHHILPKRPSKSFGNCLYKLDCIKYFSEQSYSENTVITLFDNDILITSPLTALLETIKNAGLLFYAPLDYSTEVDDKVNDLSFWDIAPIYEEDNNTKVTVSSNLLGGEFIGATASSIKTLYNEVSKAFNATLNRLESGKNHLITEEHIYTYCNYTLNACVLPQHNLFIRRIWTGKVDTRAPGDIDTCAWHLPREKRYAFNRLFKALFQQRKGLYKSLLSETAGIPKAGLKKKILDTVTYINIKLTSK